MRFLAAFFFFFCLNQFCPFQLWGQVLTLDQNECVKVRAKLSEVVPHNKYKNKYAFFWGSDIVRPGIELKPDTAAILIEDEIVLFFVWKKSSVLRIVTRKENNKTFKTRPNKTISLSAASLTGLTNKEVYNQLDKVQKRGACLFTGVVYDHSRNVSLLPRFCMPLLFTAGGKENEFYRILNISSFNLFQNFSHNQNYTKIINPEFTFGRSDAGFTDNEITKISKSKPGDWINKLGRIYELMFSTSSPKPVTETENREGDKPLPLSPLSQIESWPWSFGYTLNSDSYLPVYHEKRIVGYKFLNSNWYSEEKGYLIVPGKFFISNRLQVQEVNDYPWTDFQHNLLFLKPKSWMPIFPGGEKALKAYFVNASKSHPIYSKSWPISLSLVIDKSGKPIQVKVLNDSKIDSSLKNAILNMPAWIPGLHNGIPINTEMRFRIPVEANSLNMLDEQIYLMTDPMPQFPGGFTALNQYLDKNFRYGPALPVKNKILIAQFIVAETGELYNISILKGVSPNIDKEVIRRISNMPLWEPGKKDGRTVKVLFTIPIKIIDKSMYKGQRLIN